MALLRVKPRFGRWTPYPGASRRRFFACGTLREVHLCDVICCMQVSGQNRTGVMPRATPSKSVGSNSRGGTTGNRKGGGTSRQKAKGGGQRSGTKTGTPKATGTRGKKGRGSSGGGGGNASTRMTPKATTRTSRKSQSRGSVDPSGGALQGDQATGT